jgi:parvulin-like peptidyl-prolyl isomerase
MVKMRWMSVIILFLCMNIFAQTEKRYVKVLNENLRLEPNGAKIGEIVGGSEVEVIERQSNWAKVQINAWIWEPSLTSDYSMTEGYQIRASHILVESEAEAQTILDQLGQGITFQELAQQYSIDSASGAKGGDLGKFGRGDLQPDYENVIFNLEPGATSGIVKTELGYHIFRRTE